MSATVCSPVISIRSSRGPTLTFTLLWDAAGKPILPMVKVRGRDYLRLIYGIDYLDPAYFSIIKNRYA
jgi:hypothetical protein